jgi:hypothetical protein
MIDLNMAVVDYWECSGRRRLFHNLDLPDLPSPNSALDMALNQNSSQWNNNNKSTDLEEVQYSARVEAVELVDI